MNEKTVSAYSPILIAIITVLGSLGVAYITTGARFQAELEISKQSISQLKDQFAKIQETFAADKIKFEQQQQIADRRINALNLQLQESEARNKELQAQLAKVQTGVDQAEDRLRIINSDTDKIPIFRPPH